jgi:hypothetical protein
MKRLLVVFALVGRMFGNPCADHNIFLSESAVTISISGSALCNANTVDGITFVCGSGDGGMSVWGFDIQSACVTKWVSYAVQTADSSGKNYDLGLYYIKGPSAASLAGKLIVHTGELAGSNFGTAGLTTKSWAGTANCSIPCTLPAGQYALAIATDCSATCAVLYGDDNRGYMYLFDAWLGGDGGTHQNLALLPSACLSGNTCTFKMATAPGLPLTIGTVVNHNAPPVTDPSMWQTSFPKPPAVLIF